MSENNLNIRIIQSSRYDPSSMTRVIDLDSTDDDDLVDVAEIKQMELERANHNMRQQAFIGILAFICTAGVAFCGAFVVQSMRGMKPPSNISSECSPIAVTTIKGYSGCERICAKAECCRLSVDDPLSCVEEEADACETYSAYCKILSFDHDNDGKVEIQEQVEVPPAASDIDKICQWDNLASITGFFDCEKTCNPGNCCHDKIGTCKVINPEMCHDYDACDILHVQNIVTIPPALPNIADLCAPEALYTPAKYNMCKNACDPGECCLEPIEACKVQNPSMCADFEVCKILHGTPKSHPTSIKSQVVTKCNTAALSTPEGIEECKDVCEPAFCCFPSMNLSSRPNRSSQVSTGTCDTPENEGWCSQYSACQTLLHADDGGIDTHTDAQATVKEACADASPDGIARCSNVCVPAHCCFDETQNCFENGMEHLRCSDYDACGILYHNDKDPSTTVNPNPVAMETDHGSLLEVAEYVLEVCSKEKIKTSEGREECLNLCEDNLCCFAPGDYNCIAEHKEMCVVYAGCDNIVRAKGAPDLESPKPLPTSNIPSVENPTSINEELTEKCQEEKLKALGGFVDCHDMCKAHLCCFSPDQRENCYVDHPLECDDYMPCAKLVSGSASDVDKVEDDTRTQKDIVREVCDASSILTEEGFTKCHSLCSKYLCCFSPSGTKSNCVDTMGSDKCLEYEECYNLVMAGDGPAEAPTMVVYDESSWEDSLEYKCSEEYINDEGNSDCQRMCDDRRCCLEEGPGNCRVTDKEFCNESNLCMDKSGDVGL